MKNLLWLFRLYPSFTCRTIIAIEFCCDRRAYRHRLAIDRRFTARPALQGGMS